MAYPHPTDRPGGEPVIHVGRATRVTIALALGAALGVGAPRAQPAAPWGSADTLRLGVDAAVRLALGEGVEAAIARQEVAAAATIVGIARSYALPSVDFLGSYVRNLKKPVIFFEIDPGDVQSFEIGQDNAWTAGLALRQTLWASGRVRSGYRSAQERAAAAALSGDDMAAGIARDVRSACYGVMLAGAQTEIARRALEQARRNVAQISVRVGKGVTPEFEMLRAQVTVANRRALHTRARNAESTTQEALKRLIGVALERPIVMTDSLSFVDYVEPLEAVLARALASRRDLAAARRTAQSAEFEYRARAANDMPLLYFDASAGWLGETSDGVWPGDRETATSASIGLTLAWPIFDGLRNRSETRAARANAEASRLRVRQVEQIVRLEVRSGWAEVQAVAEENVAAGEALALARRAYEIAQVRYHTGMSTLVELLDAELALIESALNVSETLYRYNVALARLAYSVGEGPLLGEAEEEGTR